MRRLPAAHPLLLRHHPRVGHVVVALPGRGASAARPARGEARKLGALTSAPAPPTLSAAGDSAGPAAGGGVAATLAGDVLFSEQSANTSITFISGATLLEGTQSGADGGGSTRPARAQCARACSERLSCGCRQGRAAIRASRRAWCVEAGGSRRHAFCAATDAPPPRRTGASGRRRRRGRRRRAGACAAAALRCGGIALTRPCVSFRPPRAAQQLRVTVSDPVTQGEGVNAHVSYRVSTEARPAAASCFMQCGVMR